MPEVVFSVDQAKSMRDQAVPGHNRWHPDVPAAATVRPGQEFRVECREWTDSQMGNNDSANDVRDVDLTRCHMLSGPIAIEGAEPGDLLVVDILDLGPVPQETGPTPGQGLGLHRDLRQGERRRLPHRPLPGRVQGDLGLPRTAGNVSPHSGCEIHRASPTQASSARRHRRAARPMERPGAGPHRDRPRSGAAACAPATRRRHLGRAGHRRGRREGGQGGCSHRPTTGERRQPRHQELHSRIPGVLPRARGRSAKLSGGDLHFSQGDGEITFCGAIEMGGFIDFHVDLIKGGMETYGITTNPVFMPGNVEPRYSEFLTFIGISVEHEDNTNRLHRRHRWPTGTRASTRSST